MARESGNRWKRDDDIQVHKISDDLRQKKKHNLGSRIFYKTFGRLSILQI